MNDIASLLLQSQPIQAQTQLQPAMMPEAFTWGAGGSRMTPDELARRRQIADAEMQGNYSPVGSWTEGLGRVADGVIGGLETRKLNNADEANTAYSDKIAQALLGGDASGSGSAMIDPYASPQVQGLAKMMWERAHPKQTEPPEIVQLAQIANDPSKPDWARSAATGRIEALNNPVISTPWGGLVLRSDVLGQLQGGGGPASGMAGAPAPASPNIDFSVFTPEEIAVWQKEAQRRKGNNTPSGSPLSPPKTLPPDFDFGGH